MALMPGLPGRPWRTPRTRAFGKARKHKMEARPEGVPLAKKRLTEEAAVADPPWALAAASPRHVDADAARTRPATEVAPWEEMEDAPGEVDAARRKLREIEERITDDDDDDDRAGAVLAGRSGPVLPTLVLSDALKTGLRRDFEGGLTKKIIESMSRPSMELVLWKPLPGLLGSKTAGGGRSSERTPARTPPHPPPPPPLLYAGDGPSAEEEMEL